MLAHTGLAGQDFEPGSIMLWDPMFVILYFLAKMPVNQHPNPPTPPPYNIIGQSLVIYRFIRFVH